VKRNIAALVLAAGASRRMGTAKQLLRLGSRTLLRRIVEESLASAARETFVVLGPEAERMCEELHGLPATIVENPRWAAGIGTSVSAGIATIGNHRPQFDAAIVLTCDQPHVSTATLNRLIDEHDASGKPLIGSAYADTIGVPALFSRAYFDALTQLPPETGAKEILRRSPDDVLPVEFALGAVDLDTPSDYDRFARSADATS
jgi:molybdenum cofactor cytidylyltransferase